jgi:S-adenosylmethionine:tRNA ribosyltransferase-isomerase
MNLSNLVRELPASEYHYPLPPERIAEHPLPERDASRLLISDGKDHRQDVFRSIPEHLPPRSLLIFNDTRVVHARLHFLKASGARIEVFLLEPVAPVIEIQQAFQQKSGVRWKVLVGNSRRWNEGSLELSFQYEDKDCLLSVAREEVLDGFSIVSFSWSPPDLDFAGVLQACGKVPLPPYIHREAEPEDDTRYQCVYAHHDGSVAAPTAGLHFTPGVLQELAEAGHISDRITLHVGAGTFRPVGSETIGGHTMHTEQILVGKETIRRLADFQGQVIAVGTTSVRTLESLYWLGVQAARDHILPSAVEQWEPYDNTLQETGLSDSLSALLLQMENAGVETLRARTQLIIVPGYRFRIINGMITNFHQPGSTLLMLVAAYLGDGWKQAYQYALDHDFRFLSYGDSCLFLR